MVMKITRLVYEQIGSTIATRPPECGGVLGAGADGIITEFFFDETGISTPNGYAPDVAAINEMLTHDWMPRGILMVGIVHSHSGGNNVPSCGDIGYGIRILQALDTVDRFYLPIVTVEDGEMRLNCYVVCPDEKYEVACRKIEYIIISE